VRWMWVAQSLHLASDSSNSDDGDEEVGIVLQRYLQVLRSARSSMWLFSLVMCVCEGGCLHA